MDKPQELEFARLLFGGIAIMVLLALTIILFIVIYQRRLFLQQKKLHQFAIDYQKGLLESAVQSQESERERIAQDLHDEVGASLSAAKLFVNQIQYEPSADDMKDLAKQASQIIGDTVHDIRQIAQNLSPILLENFGLPEAINILLNRLKVTGIKIDHRISGTFESLNKEKQLALYRIIQEVTGNVLKHAAATHLLLELTEENSGITLRIEDNGCGFDQSKNDGKSSGMGMETIKARAGLLNGQLTISSVVRQGTRFKLSIPLQAS